MASSPTTRRLLNRLPKTRCASSRGRCCMKNSWSRRPWRSWRRHQFPHSLREHMRTVPQRRCTSATPRLSRSQLKRFKQHAQFSRHTLHASMCGHNFYFPSWVWEPNHWHTRSKVALETCRKSQKKSLNLNIRPHRHSIRVLKSLLTITTERSF